MTIRRCLAALPILAALALAAPSAQALSIRMERFDTAADGMYASASKQRAKPAATQKSGKQSQGMVCTTRQTTTKVGLFRKLIKSKSITVCTPAKNSASNQPAGQGPVVETSAAGGSSDTGSSSHSGGNSNAGGGSNSGSNSNAGGNTDSGGDDNAGGSEGGGGEDVDDYVSEIIDSPPVFVPAPFIGDEPTGGGGGEDSTPPLLASAPTNEVPEPGTLALLGLGLAGLGFMGRRKSR